MIVGGTLGCITLAGRGEAWYGLTGAGHFIIFLQYLVIPAGRLIALPPRRFLSLVCHPATVFSTDRIAGRTVGGGLGGGAVGGSAVGAGGSVLAGGFVPQARGLVQHQHRVDPDIAFRMERWVLWHADQRAQLRKPLAEPVHLAQGLEEQRGARCLPERLFHLRLHPLRRQGPHIHLPAQGERLRRDPIREARRKLGHSEHAQRVLDEGFAVYVPEDAVLQVSQSAEEVQHFAAQHILHERVDRQITPAGRLLRRKIGVHIYRKIAVPPAGRLFPARHGDIQMSGQAVDAEGEAHLAIGADAVQNGLQRGRRDPVHLDIHIVDIVGSEAAQPVPNAAAHIVGPSPDCRDLLCDSPGGMPCQAVVCFHGQSPPPRPPGIVPAAASTHGRLLKNPNLSFAKVRILSCGGL